MTKSLFADKLQVSSDILKIHELDQMKQGTELQAMLEKITGQRTVPNVFVNGQHIGGNDDTQAAYKSGKLKDLLSKGASL